MAADRLTDAEPTVFVVGFDPHLALCVSGSMREALRDASDDQLRLVLPGPQLGPIPDRQAWEVAFEHMELDPNVVEVRDLERDELPGRHVPLDARPRDWGDVTECRPRAPLGPAQYPVSTATFCWAGPKSSSAFLASTLGNLGFTRA